MLCNHFCIIMLMTICWSVCKRLQYVHNNGVNNFLWDIQSEKKSTVYVTVKWVDDFFLSSFFLMYDSYTLLIFVTVNFKVWFALRLLSRVESMSCYLHLSHPHPSKQSRKGFLFELALFCSHHNRIIIVEMGCWRLVCSMSNIRTLKGIMLFLITFFL